MIVAPFFLLVCLLAASVRAQGYCQCQAGGFVNDPLQQCMTSGNYDVQNSCFVCPVQNATAKYYYCRSLYALGFGVCGQSGAITAMKAACAAIGGDTSSSDFRCLDSSGLNKSQAVACSGVTAAPTVPTTPAPTSDANRTDTPYALLLTVGLILFLVAAA